MSLKNKPNSNKDRERHSEGWYEAGELKQSRKIGEGRNVGKMQTKWATKSERGLKGIDEEKFGGCQFGLK